MVPDLPPGGIILGLGCDVVEVARIRGVLERHPERFLDRVFSDEERRYCFDRSDPYVHLAARWAAKEAVSKCFTTGIGAAFGWKSASIRHGSRMEPLVSLDEKGMELLRAVGASRVLVSLSHTAVTAMAVAVLLKDADPATLG